MTVGLLVSSISWLMLTSAVMLAFSDHLAGWLAAVGLSLKASTVLAALTLVVLAVGEMIQSPRYYEYISRLAPEGQQGTYMGFAFLPIAIGFVIAGRRPAGSLRQTARSAPLGLVDHLRQRAIRHRPDVRVR
jgi:dipeptide/tripeptide permease